MIRLKLNKKLHSKYPYIGINSTRETVVIFVDKDCGFALAGIDCNDDVYEPHYSQSWNEEAFIPYTEDIILS